ncbi:MAG: DUF4176 domain-containing protein [Oscillospiraceae bacterium]|nr:DUF4176 domain-containing protein [Oscillospiraceae bacterium]
MNTHSTGDKKYLPIGSVVLLKGGQKRVMIYGRLQRQVSNEAVWDYIGCLYPEGNISEEYTFLFNHGQIDTVYFIGFQDGEELEFKKRLEEKNI